MKRLRILVLMLVVAGLLAAFPAQAQAPVEVTNVDGFANSCDVAQVDALFTVRYNVPGNITVRAQAWGEFYDETSNLGPTAGGGAVHQFSVNAPRLPANTVVQYSISNGDPATAVYVAVQCSTGAVINRRIIGQDGRLLAGDDLPVVIYPSLDRSGNPILVFFTVDANGRGRRSLTVSHAMLTALPARPAANTRIASTPDGLATLYRLTTGEYQVNFAPDAEGKVRVVVFDALSPTRVRRQDIPS